jgi:hypothetical protein
MITPLMGSTVSRRPAGAAVCEVFDATKAKKTALIQAAMIKEIFTEGVPGIQKLARSAKR